MNKLSRNFQVFLDMCETNALYSNAGVGANAVVKDVLEKKRVEKLLWVSWGAEGDKPDHELPQVQRIYRCSPSLIGLIWTGQQQIGKCFYGGGQAYSY